MKAYAFWLVLSMAGAKDTDRCDPTRERDDAMCLRNGKRDPKCCACLFGFSGLVDAIFWRALSMRPAIDDRSENFGGPRLS